MNHAAINEILEKENRLKNLIANKHYEAIIIGRQDNFSWFTCGGTNTVVYSSERGVCYIVVTEHKTYLIAMQMDCRRLLDEEFKGHDLEVVCLRWCDEKPLAVLMRMFSGLNCLTDVDLGFGKCAPAEIYAMHFPLTVSEIARLREIGAATDCILKNVADGLKPGMTDYEAAAMLGYEYAKIDAFPEVMLVGIDERIANYRHCIPSGKKIGKTVLMHTAIRMYGLHANVTRMVSFGEPDSQFKRKFAAAESIISGMAEMCRLGARFTDIHESAGKNYAACDFANEWFEHYIGGTTAYFLSDSSVWFDADAKIQANQAYDWFVTISGVKIEELFFLGDSHFETLSCTGAWPVKEYFFDKKILLLPQVYIR